MELLPILEGQSWFVHVVTAVLILNIVLTAVAQVAEVLKAQAKLPWLAKAAAAVQKLVDIVSANKKH